LRPEQPAASAKAMSIYPQPDPRRDSLVVFARKLIEIAERGSPRPCRERRWVRVFSKVIAAYEVPKTPHLNPLPLRRGEVRKAGVFASFLNDQRRPSEVVKLTERGCSTYF